MSKKTIIQPYSWDRIDKAFDYYYDEESERADYEWTNIRDYDRQMFREWITKFVSWEVSDWYHTFNELYAHRIALYCALVNTRIYDCHKSKLHNDGSSYDWRFIVVMYINCQQISYHIPMDKRDYFDCEQRERADEWNWHTGEDVIDVLLTS